MDPFYGLLDDALEGGYVIKPVNGKYCRGHIPNDEKLKEDDIYTSKFWGPIFKDTDFYSYIETKYKFSKDLDFIKDEENICNLLG